MASAPEWWAHAHMTLVEAQTKALVEELAPIKSDLQDCKTRLTSVETTQSAMEDRLVNLESGKGPTPAGFTATLRAGATLMKRASSVTHEPMQQHCSH